MSQHIVPQEFYIKIFATLLVLTFITVGIAYLDLGRLNSVAALTIAVGKSLLVILYFMHVRYSSRLTWVLIGAGVFWLVLLISFTMSDMLTRDWLPISRGWTAPVLPFPPR